MHGDDVVDWEGNIVGKYSEGAMLSTNVSAATTAQIKATIVEHGNGLPGIGDLCYDSNTDTVYKIVAWDGSDRISTNGPGCGNSINVLLEECGSASDTTQDEWDSIESNNYGVNVEEEI